MGQGMKKEIYFCDDDNNILYAMKLSMSKAPFKASFFNDPVEMISQLEPDWPGIIVTDLTMPKIDGFEVIERVKRIDPDIPIIVLTGNVLMKSAYINYTFTKS